MKKKLFDEVIAGFSEAKKHRAGKKAKVRVTDFDKYLAKQMQNPEVRRCIAQALRDFDRLIGIPKAFEKSPKKSRKPVEFWEGTTVPRTRSRP